MGSCECDGCQERGGGKERPTAQREMADVERMMVQQSRTLASRRMPELAQVAIVYN